MTIGKKPPIVPHTTTMPAKLERCVKRLKRRGGVRNPWAVCNAAISGKKKRKRKKKRQ